MATVKAQVDDLTKLSRQLRRAYPEVGKQLGKDLGEVGRMIRDDARARASAFSKKIPRTIRSSRAGSTVSITVGNAKQPLGALYERPGGFRHPLFGSKKRWYGEGSKRMQGPHQTIHPALAANEDRAREIILEGAIKRVYEALGMEPENG